jgi:hypothetical protein
MKIELFRLTIASLSLFSSLNAHALTQEFQCDSGEPIPLLDKKNPRLTEYVFKKTPNDNLRAATETAKLKSGETILIDQMGCKRLRVGQIPTFFVRFQFPEKMARYTDTKFWINRVEGLLTDSGLCFAKEVSRWCSIIKKEKMKTRFETEPLTKGGKAFFALRKPENGENENLRIDVRGLKGNTLIHLSNIAQIESEAGE